MGPDPISNDALCEVLQWAAEHGFSADPETAFSLDTWQHLGDRLLYEFAYGDQNMGNLICTWRVLFYTLQRFKAGEEGEELLDLESCEEDKVSEGMPESGETESDEAGASPAPTELVAVVEAVQMSYPLHLTRMKESERLPPFTPTAIPSSAPLPLVNVARPVIPTAPLLPQSGTAAETLTQGTAPPFSPQLAAAGGNMAAAVASPLKTPQPAPAEPLETQQMRPVAPLEASTSHLPQPHSTAGMAGCPFPHTAYGHPAPVVTSHPAPVLVAPSYPTHAPASKYLPAQAQSPIADLLTQQITVIPEAST